MMTSLWTTLELQMSAKYYILNCNRWATLLTLRALFVRSTRQARATQTDDCIPRRSSPNSIAQA